MERLTVHEMIDAIRRNYPPQQYAMLRESLDHAIDLMTAEAEDRLLVLPCQVRSWLTNADRIRQMSDEELAKWLSDNDSYFPTGNRTQYWLDWLKQEVLMTDDSC